MVQVVVVGRLELEGLEGDVVESLVVEAEGHVAVLHQLVHQQDGVVRLNHDLRDLREKDEASCWYLQQQML